MFTFNHCTVSIDHAQTYPLRNLKQRRKINFYILYTYVTYVRVTRDRSEIEMLSVMFAVMKISPENFSAELHYEKPARKISSCVSEVR